MSAAPAATAATATRTTIPSHWLGARMSLSPVFCRTFATAAIIARNRKPSEILAFLLLQTSYF
jgi:hypothetical protein